MKPKHIIFLTVFTSFIIALILCASTVINIMNPENAEDFMENYGNYILKVRHPLCSYTSYEDLGKTVDGHTFRINFKGRFTKNPYFLDVSLQYNNMNLLSGFLFGKDTCPIQPEDTKVFLGRMWNRRGIMMISDLMKLRQALEKPIEPLAAVNDITPIKAKAKFKYKKESPSEAQQGWKLAGECPTTITKITDNTKFHVQGRLAGEQNALNHDFIYPSKINKKGTRCTAKFRYPKYKNKSPDEKSEGHHMPSYGFLKTRIKDGNMKFIYIIGKANEGGKMVGMEHYDTVRDYMNENKTYESTAQFETSLGVTQNSASETHGMAAGFAFKAKKKGGRGKIIQ